MFGIGVVALLALLASACSGPRLPSTEGAADGGSDSKLGVRVSLPEGWVALAGPEGSLRAGPEGRVVLRVERQADAGARLPAPEALRAGFASGLKLLTVREMGVTRTDDFTAVKLTLTRGGKLDGGLGQQEAFTLLAAKRVGPDLFLCATAPGTSEAELEAAGRICGSLGSGRAPGGFDGGT